MSELEGMSAEDQERAARLYKFVKSNPGIEKDIRRQAKKIDPKMAAPDIELEDALEAQRVEFNKELKTRDDNYALQRQNEVRAQMHDKCRGAGLDPVAVEKTMVEENIVNYDTAIKYLKLQTESAPATHRDMTSMSMPDNKDLWKDKNSFARKTAHEAINDIKSGRVRLS